MNKVMTVEELYKRLEDLIVLGYGDKRVGICLPEYKNVGFCTGAFFSEEFNLVEVKGC
jgi:hypothetical protein